MKKGAFIREISIIGNNVTKIVNKERGEKMKKLMFFVFVISLTPAMLLSSIIWTNKTPMPTARSYVCAGVVNDKIYVFGGSNSSGILNTVEMYDPIADTWTTKTPMPTARRMAACGVVDGKIYVIGGEANGTALGTVEVYDPATDSWESKKSMPTARSGHAVGVVKGKIYAVGGDFTSYIAIKTVEMYDPLADTWVSKTDMPTARFWLTTAVTNDSLIYAIGGAADEFYGFPANEVYDPSTDTWVSRQPMLSARFAPVSCVMNDTIFVIGGFDVGQSYFPLDTVERYDEGEDSWFDDTHINPGRYLSAGAVVSGKMYVIGGFTGYAGGYSNINEEGTPVPTGIELLSFNAISFSNGILLTWFATLGTDKVSWVIEKVRGKGKNFHRIATIPTEGNTPHSQRFEYEDRDVIPNIGYYYRLGKMNLNGKVEWLSTSFAVAPLGTGIPSIRSFPEPSNGKAKITFSIPAKSFVNVEIYNNSGQLVRTILRKPLKKGDYRFKWDGKNSKGMNVPSGCYFVKVESKQNFSIKKITLLR